jgi:hypothetical protein
MSASHKAGVAGIYNRSSYATEKRAELESDSGHEYWSCPLAAASRRRGTELISREAAPSLWVSLNAARIIRGAPDRPQAFAKRGLLHAAPGHGAQSCL